MQLFCLYTAPYTAQGCIYPLRKQQPFILHLLNKNVQYKWVAVHSVCRWEREQLQWDAVTCAVQGIGCCQSCCLLLASCRSGVWERPLGTSQTRSVPALCFGEPMTVHAGDFVHIGENTCERAIGELLGSSPRVAWQSWRVQAGLGKGECVKLSAYICVETENRLCGQVKQG